MVLGLCRPLVVADSGVKRPTCCGAGGGRDGSRATSRGRGWLFAVPEALHWALEMLSPLYSELALCKSLKLVVASQRRPA